MLINAATSMPYAPAGARTGRGAPAASPLDRAAPGIATEGDGPPGRETGTPDGARAATQARDAQPNSPAAQRRAALEDPNSPESREVRELARTDREVRTHEMAHMAAAGGHARGGPVYEFRVGPDGKRYAVGGHVNIDTSAVPGDPQATLRKAQTIQRAALAPAEPSAQDRRVAAQAAAMAAEARAEMAEQRRTEADTEAEPARAGAEDGHPALDGPRGAGADAGQRDAPPDRSVGGRLIALVGAVERSPAAATVDAYA